MCKQGEPPGQNGLTDLGLEEVADAIEAARNVGVPDGGDGLREFLASELSEQAKVAMENGLGYPYRA